MFYFIVYIYLLVNVIKATPIHKRSIDQKDHLLFSNVNSLLKRLDIVLEKPVIPWITPNKLSSHPAACDELNYCQGDFIPPPGSFYRLPMHPWWYYSCEGNTVKCEPCQTRRDQPTLFFSERCQQCLLQYEDENIICPDKNNKIS